MDDREWEEKIRAARKVFDEGDAWAERQGYLDRPAHDLAESMSGQLCPGCAICGTDAYSTQVRAEVDTFVRAKRARLTQNIRRVVAAFQAASGASIDIGDIEPWWTPTIPCDWNENSPDDTQLSWDEWNAKVDALLAECASQTTAYDVLQRARAIVQEGPIPDACAPYCLGCAIARAKEQLDEERGDGISDGELLMQALEEAERPGEGFQEIPSDAPLVQARELLRAYDERQPTQDACLAVLDEVLAQRNN